VTHFTAWHTIPVNTLGDHVVQCLSTQFNVVEDICENVGADVGLLFHGSVKVFVLPEDFRRDLARIHPVGIGLEVCHLGLRKAYQLLASLAPTVA
jgi:hypothetical protein